MTAWTEERVAMLRKLAGKKMSASQIAAEFGDVTRNSVISKARRLGLTLGGGTFGGQRPVISSRVIELANSGHAPREILSILWEEGTETTLGSIKAIVSLARRRGEVLPYVKRQDGVREGSRAIVVDCGEFEAGLRAAAKSRRMAPSALAGLILDAVITDDLVNAVLDT